MFICATPQHTWHKIVSICSLQFISTFCCINSNWISLCIRASETFDTFDIVAFEETLVTELVTYCAKKTQKHKNFAEKNRIHRDTNEQFKRIHLKTHIKFTAVKSDALTNYRTHYHFSTDSFAEKLQNNKQNSFDFKSYRRSLSA